MSAWPPELLMLALLGVPVALLVVLDMVFYFTGHGSIFEPVTLRMLRQQTEILAQQDRERAARRDDKQ